MLRRADPGGLALWINRVAADLADTRLGIDHEGDEASDGAVDFGDVDAVGPGARGLAHLIRLPFLPAGMPPGEKLLA